MKNEIEFDFLITSGKKLPKSPINNLAELLFKELPNRNENSSIILSHENEKYVDVKLKRLRFIVASLFEEFNKKGIKPGDTVLLTTLNVDNVLFLSLMFIGLITFGARVLLPMFVETLELNNWIHFTKCDWIIIPEKEILALNKNYEMEKQIIKKIKQVANDNNVITFDLAEDFNILAYLYMKSSNNFSIDKNEIINNVINNTNVSTESVIFTTSGTSGKSKLVVYEQGAFIRNCISWREAGMYEKNKLFGRSFIDIFPHTISIRALFNALWTGYPVSIIISDWIKSYPQKTFLLLTKMKPEIITIGPSSFSFVIEEIKLLPELKNIIFSDLKTVVSTGAPYSKKIAEDINKYFGLFLHNAYGTSETQQVLTTVLDDKTDINNVSMGKPLPGVSIGLKNYINDRYRMFIKSPYGFKYSIDVDTKKSYFPKEYFYTGDIVRINENNGIFYVGREDKDFFKNGFGAKVPISFMKKYYESLYKEVKHIEFYPTEVFTILCGVAALIFIEDKNIPTGRITKKKVIRKFAKKIKKINSALLKTVEPFEYEHRRITRFLLINNNVPTTLKKTVSKYKIETIYRDEINDLKISDDYRSGVKNVFTIRFALLKCLLNFLPYKFVFFRKIILKIFSW